jgi:uncharacterized small protein (TIGR04563 family)
MSDDNKKDGRKVSLYIPLEMAEQVRAESARLDRSFSWLVQRALKVALPEIQKMSSVSDE